MDKRNSSESEHTPAMQGPELDPYQCKAKIIRRMSVRIQTIFNWNKNISKQILKIKLTSIKNVKITRKDRNLFILDMLISKPYFLQIPL